ncbi:MAG: hypothetical protein EXR01_08905 [Acetobacteraceae bacterium]|nr:hypothetical protein [Acetobacteraceae bacterium]
MTAPPAQREVAAFLTRLARAPLAVLEQRVKLRRAGASGATINILAPPLRAPAVRMTGSGSIRPIALPP